MSADKILLYQAVLGNGRESILRSQLRAAGLARASQFSWAKTGWATAEVLSQYG